jgi:hypothetical protein
VATIGIVLESKIVGNEGAINPKELYEDSQQSWNRKVG